MKEADSSQKMKYEWPKTYKEYLTSLGIREM